MAVIETMDQWFEYYSTRKEINRNNRDYNWRGLLKHLSSEIIEREKPITLADISDDVVKKMFLLMAQTKTGSYSIDKDNEDAINIIIMYLRRDEKFLKVNPAYSFDKSLAIIGPVGTGKTSMFKALDLFYRSVVFYTYRDYSLKNETLAGEPFDTITANELNRRFSVDGNKIFYNVSGEKVALPYKDYIKTPLFIDDIGTEGEASHYGIKTNLIAELIQMRYEARSLTHFTSNLGHEALKEVYGIRAYDRLREMVNIITLTGNSRRK